MKVGKVVGNVWATRKEDGLVGLKLLIVEIDNNERIVACDNIGAGNGDMVLVSTGSSARKILERDDSPIDAAIIGIIDQIEN